MKKPEPIKGIGKRTIQQQSFMTHRPCRKYDIPTQRTHLKIEHFDHVPMILYGTQNSVQCVISRKHGKLFSCRTDRDDISILFNMHGTFQKAKGSAMFAHLLRGLSERLYCQQI